jgi:hypothetical protein
MNPEGMQEVCCPDCGASLGYQQADTHIDWQQWRHARCPVRLATKLGLNEELYDKALGVATVAIAGAYPDFPNNVLDDRKQDDVRNLRAKIAAEVVLESLGIVGFKLRTA